MVVGRLVDVGYDLLVGSHGRRRSGWEVLDRTVLLHAMSSIAFLLVQCHFKPWRDFEVKARDSNLNGVVTGLNAF